LPQPPQLLLSVCVSVHVLLHIVSPMGHVHVPLLHVAPEGHERPQVPQWEVSVSRLTQALLQSVSTGPASVVQSTLHVPLRHTGRPELATQALPQVPQLFGSLRTAVQAPPLHMRSPAGQAQRPAWHVVPFAQRMPQPPQLIPSVCALTHTLPHAVKPAAHPHVPLLHVWLLPHFVPHLPQLLMSVCRVTHVPVLEQYVCPGVGQVQRPA
jgi:hypothetical protein